MVEGNRSRFHLSDAELQSRKRFVTDSRRTLEDLQKDREFDVELVLFCTWIWKIWPKINQVKFMQHRMLKLWSACRMWTDHKPERSLRMTRRHEGYEICRCSWSTVDMYVKYAGSIWNHFWDCGILAACGTSLRLRWVSKTLLGIWNGHGKMLEQNECPASWPPLCRQHSPGDAFFRCIECSNKRLCV